MSIILSSNVDAAGNPEIALLGEATRAVMGETYRLKKEWQYDECIQFDGSYRMGIAMSDKHGWPLHRVPAQQIQPGQNPAQIVWIWQLFIPFGPEWMPLRANDWACKDNRGGFFTVRDEDFKERYVLSSK